MSSSPSSNGPNGGTIFSSGFGDPTALGILEIFNGAKQPTVDMPEIDANILVNDLQAAVGMTNSSGQSMGATGYGVGLVTDWLLSKTGRF